MTSITARLLCILKQHDLGVLLGDPFAKSRQRTLRPPQVLNARNGRISNNQNSRN